MHVRCVISIVSCLPGRLSCSNSRENRGEGYREILLVRKIVIHSTYSKRCSLSVLTRTCPTRRLLAFSIRLSCGLAFFGELPRQTPWFSRGLPFYAWVVAGELYSLFTFSVSDLTARLRVLLRHLNRNESDKFAHPFFHEWFGDSSLVKTGGLVY